MKSTLELQKPTKVSMATQGTRRLWVLGDSEMIHGNVRVECGEETAFPKGTIACKDVAARKDLAS